MKKGLFLVAALVAVIFMGTGAYAIDIYFEHRTSEEISRGVVYEQNRMMTSRGMLDVHVLFIDLEEPYLTLAPVASAREVGLRETTSRLLSDAGAVAGINADFFGLASNPAFYFGPMVREGQILSLNATTPPGEFATFFLDMNNNPFFLYMQAFMRVYANGRWIFNVLTYNNTGPFINVPTVVCRNVMECTTVLSARFPNTVKFIVEDNFVTHIEWRGNPVQTPENGFVIIMPPAYLGAYVHHLLEGSHVHFQIETNLNVDFSSIQAAIGGGQVILQNGRLIENRGHEPNWRHPRVAVGARYDGQLVFMVADGRTHSIGVTHAELGALLLRYGVINAMHMDGGGSATMVARTDSGAYSVLNTPSEGTQRRVTNALGVFDHSPVGELAGISLVPAERLAVLAVPMPVNVFGVDAWGNSVPDEITPVFLADPADGFWYEGRYTPLRTGLHILEARYGELTAFAEVYVYALAELQPRVRNVSLFSGNRVRLTFSGIATDGTQVNIPEVTGLSVSPAYLGTFENGYFIAARGGVGYISAVVGSVRAYIPVTVGGFPWSLALFAAERGVLTQPPAYVDALVSTENVLGRELIRFEYGFSATTATQAATVTFYPPLEIPGEPIALQMQFYGDGSGHWLRGRVRDADGVFHNIDFARNVDFIGRETVMARLPNAPAPFTLDRVWLASLSETEPTRHLVFFYGLEALYAPNQTIAIPQGTVFQDRLRANPDFTGVPGGGAFEFEIWEENTFEVFGVSRFAVARLGATNGGIRAAGIGQWQMLMPQLRRVNQPYVVILLDAAPTDFARRMEYELFHLAMTQLRDEGRTVFVVFPSEGEETTLSMRDNIRYIATHTGSVRFWTDAERIWWN